MFKPSVRPSAFLELKAMRAAATISQGSEFQDFLYAQICQDQEGQDQEGQDQEGLTLSVLSALARQDLDPWTEAARLSRLSKEMAIRQITDLLDGLPGRTVARLDRTEVATRLSALLPRNAGVTLSGMLEPPASAGQNRTTFAFNWRFLSLYLCLMLLMNWLMAEFRAPPASPTVSGTSPAVVTEAPKNGSQSGRLGNTPPTTAN